MDAIEKLTEYFKEFPGIGERQAKRFVYFLMARNPSYSENLSKFILELKKEISQCAECFRFFNIGIRKENICDICSNPKTDSSMMMIVEKDSDLESIKKSKNYNGKYFVLGGLVPIVEKSTPTRIRLNELKEKINNSKNNLKEIILAFSLSPQGDHTDMYIKGQLRETAESLNIKISSLGRGLSTGTELEYSDNETIKNALINRH